MDFRSDQFTIAGTENMSGVGGAAQESERGESNGLALRAGYTYDASISISASINTRLFTRAISISTR